MTHYCDVCGSPITALRSIQRGYGDECARAIMKAKMRRIFSDDGCKRNYYRIEAEAIIASIKTMNFRSAFRKSFQKSIVSQHDWLSHKQKDIAIELIGERWHNISYDVECKRKLFLDTIPITRDDIEIARQAIRELRNK